MKRFVFPLAVVLCLLALVSQQSTVSAKDAWVSVRTKNFYLIGNANEKDIRKVAGKLEQFREAFTQLFPRTRFNTPVPTTVVVFKNKQSYQLFGPPNTGGFFQSGPDVNYIALSTDWYLRGEEGVFQIIFHEYTHLLVNNTLKGAPAWFNEGLAEYYSTFKISEDQKFVIGIEPGYHLSYLRRNKLLPLPTLFAVDHQSPYYNEKSKQGVFYAQSWALMHYLIIGKGMHEKLTTFLELIANNVPVETAFPKAFETTFDAMLKELNDYVNKSQYGILKGQFSNKLALDAISEVKPLTDAEAQAYLGDLLLHSNRRSEAETYLQVALELDPNLGMAHASLGMLRFREGKTDEARASLERATAASSQNYLAHYYYAYALSRQRPEDTQAIYTPEQLAKIRQHLRRAIELRRDFPESYTLLAFVSLLSNTEIDESIAMMKRVLRETPGHVGYMFMLAQLYMHERDYKTARPLLEQVAKSNDAVNQHAEYLLAQLDKREKQLTEGNGISTVAGPQVVAGETAVSQPFDPSSQLREALRKPADGETQVLATFVKLDCEKKDALFVFRTATGQLRLRAISLEGMLIRTFVADVQGEISCGPRKPENVVVISYLPNTDKAVKADGVLKSIEFVPADFKLKPDKQ
ncbi:MAG TPA: tetratricopeptide repeat protein [Pyrinomonadaceae bacterium]|nr:tetratricopeptide repeat protein [Pyrinomonadaceae bacterium]